MYVCICICICMYNWKEPLFYYHLLLYHSSVIYVYMYVKLSLRELNLGLYLPTDKNFRIVE